MVLIALCFTEKDSKLHQYLGVFLVNFSSDSHAADQYVGAFIPTIQALKCAPESSPLASVPVEKVLQFLVHLTKSEVSKVIYLQILYLCQIAKMRT